MVVNVMETNHLISFNCLLLGSCDPILAAAIDNIDKPNLAVFVNEFVAVTWLVLTDYPKLALIPLS